MSTINLLKYFTNVSNQQIKQFEALEALYISWNAKINVISRKDIDAFYLHHVLHSLGIAKFIDFLPESKVLDVGTGGGFPGIPLAIMFPKVQFHLIDAIGKKIKVISDVAQQLGLKNVKSTQQRAQELKGTYDFVVSRAVTQMPVFVPWIENKIKQSHKHVIKNGILYLKGGDLAQELQSFPKAQIYDLKSYFSEPFFETKKLVYLPIFA